MFLTSYPRAILHIDADAFFASVEQAIHPELKGKPVVTGKERGIVIAMSYEAKACGVKRGMMGTEAKKLCPHLLFVPSDYETCGIFSKRMFDIIRRFTPDVEEYSIDEAFSDITGLRRLHHCSYPQIAKNIKDTIEAELGITVSAGLSLTKSIAKLASKYQKPSGITCVSGREIEKFLLKNPIDAVWGFGHNSVALLQKYNIHTIRDFTKRPIEFAKNLLGKIGTELWQELSGVSVYKVDAAEKTTYATISKFKTFQPTTRDADYLYGQLLRNLERAASKMRRFHLATQKIILVLRTQQFTDMAIEIKLSRASTSVLEIIPVVREKFEEIFKPHVGYRATGVVLSALKADMPVQLSIFENPVKLVQFKQLDQAIDNINTTFGRNTVHLASTLAVSHTHNNRMSSEKIRNSKQNHKIQIPSLQIITR